MISIRNIEQKITCTLTTPVGTQVKSRHYSDFDPLFSHTVAAYLPRYTYRKLKDEDTIQVKYVESTEKIHPYP